MVAKTATASKRLLIEYRDISNNPPEGILAGPRDENNLFVWDVLVQGPEGTPFEGGVFPAEINFPGDYPLSPPTMKFVEVDIWHPNSTYLPVSERERDMLTHSCSLPKRRSVHLYSPRARRRPHAIRTRVGALDAYTQRREDSH
jgi:hypothetical protein